MNCHYYLYHEKAALTVWYAAALINVKFKKQNLNWALSTEAEVVSYISVNKSELCSLGSVFSLHSESTCVLVLLCSNQFYQIKYLTLLLSFTRFLDLWESESITVRVFCMYLQEFFHMLKDLGRNLPSSGVAAFDKWGKLELDLNTK